MRKLAHWVPRKENIYSPDFGSVPLFCGDSPVLVCEHVNAGFDIYYAEVVRLRAEIKKLKGYQKGRKK